MLCSARQRLAELVASVVLVPLVTVSCIDDPNERESAAKTYRPPRFNSGHFQFEERIKPTVDDGGGTWYACLEVPITDRQRDEPEVCPLGVGIPVELRKPARVYVTRREAMDAAAAAANAAVRSVVATTPSATNLCRNFTVFMEGRLKRRIGGSKIMRCEHWNFTEPTRPRRWRHTLLAGYKLSQDRK